jgi:hypothetical protein
VKHGSVSDKLQILAGQLLCQEDARSDHHNSLRSGRLENPQSIKDTHVGLAAACGKHTDAFEMLSKGIQSNLLVRAQLEHRFAFQYRYYTAKNKGTEAPLCRF